MAQSTTEQHGKIWIDLDNSPHVPFFSPIIRELRAREFAVVLTGRDAYQVCELADLFGLSCIRIGKHSGKNKWKKRLGAVRRSLQLLPFAREERPDLVVSHGSRSQLLTAAMLCIPSIVILDYEFVARVPFVRPTWLMAPEVISSSALSRPESEVMRYPGIKEDVYSGEFRPQEGQRAALGLSEDDIVVTLRPPATEAHYHNPESELLLDAVIAHLSTSPRVRIVIVPRNQRQNETLRARWASEFERGKLVVPEKAVDGLSLIWASDLVISGGGTMNREAAALGVPVYSIFRGQIGAVDKQLAREGRLVLLETTDSVLNKLKLVARNRNSREVSRSPALQQVVENIISALQSVRSGRGTVIERAAANGLAG